MIRAFAIAALLASSAQAATITDVRVSGAGPVTFGQVFAVGDVKKSDVLVGKLDGATVPLQVDVKATHADGSVRHAIISAQVPKAGTMQINTGGIPDLGILGSANVPAVVVSATIGGIKYSASPSGAFKASWLQGPIVNEWQSSMPLTTADSIVHPHLAARFAIRYYAASKKTRVDVTIENAWAYEPAPQNFTYDADIRIGGKSVYSKAGMTHLTHARWRKVFWDGPTIQLNTKYLIASKAVPNYDQSLVIPEVSLVALAKTFSGARIEPMAVGLAVPYMPTTGGRDDIGLMPMWAAMYLLSMDQRARDVTLGTADLSGSWSSHYRDRTTDKPVSIRDHPGMTILGKSGDTYNALTKTYDAFPPCAADGNCDTPNSHDAAHQANFAYLPYLVTGDYYYLEELQFWAMWNALSDNPAYRQGEKGLVSPGQVRAQAWSMRTLAEVAYITPDADALKSHFAFFLDSNLDWFISTYIGNSKTGNNLGVLTNGFALAYLNGTGISPWQDDFFTSAIGHAAELGFTKAATLMQWKSKFVVSRMADPAGCWLDASIYSFIVTDNYYNPLYLTFGQAWKASHSAEFNALTCNSPEMAKLLGVKVGEMTGYSDSVVGYPSNMQPALAYAVDAGLDSAKSGWDVFQTRAVKPDYRFGPQFAIIPRSYQSAISPDAHVALPPAATVPVVTNPVVVTPTPASVAGTWAKIGNENDKLTVPNNTLVRFGANGKFIQKVVSGTFAATYTFFGGDPINGTVKIVEAFTPTLTTPPEQPAKATKVTTGSNTKLAKQTGMTVTFIDPVKLSLVKSFTGVTATSKGAFTVSDVLLQPGAQYLIAVISSAGKPLDAFLLTVPK